MATAATMLSARHIQNMSEAKILQPHWGYADRALPCTNDAGSCEYLDVVYHSHDLGMLYTGIVWATIGAILFIWVIMRQWTKPSGFIGPSSLLKSTEESPQPRSTIARLKRSTASLSRQYLLPEFVRPVFGRTTRLQVLILAILLGYLTIWSFVGIVYKTWITPVKNSTLHNTRTSLGPWADRVGVLAFALIPFSVLLSSRESLLSLLTGIPYQHFNFLHRWLGYVIFAQSILHTIGWSVIEIRLYQPQPKVAREWITQKYMVWGIVAQLFLIFLFVFSLRPVIKITGYEFFRKAHYALAMLFIGGCWGHWQQLKCFLLPALLLWFLDRGVRLIRTALIHYNYLPDGHMGFQSAKTQLTRFPDGHHGDVVRLDFQYPQSAWKVGQHFYLCFPELSIWQSHPFTPNSLPSSMSGIQSHSYIVRAKGGETKKLADLAAKGAGMGHTSVILTGPYGEDTVAKLDQDTNVLCIAGGTGITYVLPTLLHLMNQPALPDRKIELIWAIRRSSDTRWIRDELRLLRAAEKSHNITIKIFVTREADSDSSLTSTSMTTQPDKKEALVTTTTITTSSLDSSSSSSVSSSSKSITTTTHPFKTQHSSSRPQRPDLQQLTTDFVETTISGPTTVYASGPGDMISDLRGIVASHNRAGQVWRGNERFDVDLICDDRLEW